MNIEAKVSQAPIDQDDLRADLEETREAARRFFAPQSGIAMVGRIDASPKKLRQYARFGDAVEIGFVNPRGGDAGGLTVVTSIEDLPDHFRSVVIRVAPERVADVVVECGRRGVRNAVVFSSGFAETGDEGAALQARLTQVAAETGVRLIGPNTNDNVFELFRQPENHRGGLIGLITQSGANGRPLVEGLSMGAAFGRWVATGNEADLEAADFINYFAQEDDYAVVTLYVEGFKSISRLRQALESANANDKPVVVLKVGATKAGAAMATSHTGHLSGADEAVSGLFDQYAVTRVRDLDALLETSNLFAKLPPGTGARCVMYTFSGGTATLMAEVAEAHGVEMPELSPGTQAELRRYIHDHVSTRNPIDNGGLIMHQPTSENRIAVLDALAADPNVDIIVVGVNAAYGDLTNVMAKDLLAWAPTAPKPVIAVWASVLTEGQGYPDLVGSGVAIFRSFSGCFEALRAFSAYQEKRRSLRRRGGEVAPLSAAQTQALAGQGVLASDAAARLVAEAGVRLARDATVGSAAEAAAAARTVGERLVLKVLSPDFPHKSDAGLVRVGVASDQAAATVDELFARARAAKPDAVIEGVQIQEFVGGGVEMILGLWQDLQCGTCLTIGFGGVYAELLKDVATRPLPVDADDIREMIAGLRLAPLLDGFRGAPPADKEALVAMALKVARLGMAAGPRLAELDLNPVIVLPDGAVAVDVLAVAGPQPSA